MMYFKNIPFLRTNSINTAIEIGESYSKEWWEQVMEDADQETKAERYNVLEFWGYVDTDILKDHK